MRQACSHASLTKLQIATEEELGIPAQREGEKEEEQKKVSRRLSDVGEGLPEEVIPEGGDESTRLIVLGSDGQQLKASTKVARILEILERVKSEGGNHKTIVFSQVRVPSLPLHPCEYRLHTEPLGCPLQFTSFFDILQSFLKHAGFKFVRCQCLSSLRNWDPY